MSNIPIRDMTQTGTPDASSLIVFDNGTMRKGTVGSMADAVRPVASQSEAQAGADNAKVMTPLRVKESIASEVGVTLASKAQGDLSNTALQPDDIGASVQAHDATLDAISGLDSSAGLVVQTAADTFTKRTISGGYAVTVTNGDGVSGNISVAVTDPELVALGGLVSASDQLPYFTGSGTAALTPLSTFGRSLIDDADAAAARTTLGAVIGTDVQAFDSDLAALAANSTNGLWARTGTGTGAARTLTGPAAGLAVTNGNGVSGNPTIALADDLAALESLSGTDTLYYRSGTSAWSPVTIGANLTFGSGILAASGGGGGSGGYWINVKDPAYGAVGNGSTDDTAAINLAIAAAVSAGGGTIYVPKGTYLITAATTTYSVPIRWLGEPGSTFKCVASTDTTFFNPTGSIAATKTITNNSLANNNWLYLNNVTGISAGSYIYIGFTDANSNFHSVIHKVVSFTANAGKGISAPNSLSVTSGSGVITVNYTSHGRSIGDPVVISGATATIGGNSPNGQFTVSAVPNANQLQVTIRKGTFTSNVTNGGGASTIVLLPSVLLSGPIPFDINTSYTTKNVQVMTPVIGGGFEKLRFDATGSTANVTALNASYTVYQVYRDLEFKSFKSTVFDGSPGTAFLLNVGYGNVLDNISAEDSGSGGYNDIAMYFQTRMSARALRSLRAFGFGPGLYNSSLSYIADVTSDYAGERGFKLAGTTTSYVGSVDMSYAGFTGVAFANGAMNNVINSIRAMGASNSSLWFSDQYNTGNYIGRVDSNGTYDGTDVYVGSTDTGNVISDLLTRGGVTNSGNATIHGWWNDYTPTLAAFSGAITSYTINSAQFQSKGKTLRIRVDVTITNAGTGASGLQITIPSGFTTALNSNPVYGYLSPGTVGIIGLTNSASSFAVFKYDSTTVIATGNRLLVEAEIKLV